MPVTIFFCESYVYSMAKMVGVLYCIIFTLTCKAQQAELDSLENVLKHYTTEDTIKLNLLNNIAFDYSGISPAKGLAAADKAINLAQKLHVTSKLATAYNYKAVNYAARGDDSLAMQFYLQAPAIHKQTGNTLRIGTTYNNIAIVLVNQGRYAEALDYHIKAEAIFESLHDEKRMANSLNNIGVIYLYVADYDKALGYYYKSLTVMEKLEDKSGLENAYTNIGLVYDHLSNFKKSLEYHNKAFALSKAAGDKAGMARTLGNMGNVYHDMDSNEKAITLYTQALVLSKEMQDQRGIASNYANIGMVYSGSGEYVKAYDYIQKSLAINTSLGDKQRMANDYNQLAQIYQDAPAKLLAELGVSNGNRFGKVLEFETKCLAIANELGSVDIQRDAWQTLYNIYDKQNNSVKALDAFKKYITFRDSIMNDETKINVTRREMQYDFEKKEAIAQAENDKRQVIANAEIGRQRVVKNAIAGGAAVLALAAMISFVFYKKRRDAVEAEKNTAFNMQVTETEMKALRAQMNPHFIFNSLNSINDYIDKNNTAKATGYTTKFAKLMRMILENSEKKEVTIEEDLTALELYIQLEQLRLDNKFTYSIAVDDAIDKGLTYIPPLLLQPFVENSIWHGIAKKQGDGHIDINIHKKGNVLTCTVQDDGIGRASGAGRVQSNHNSMGINITKARIDILNKQKGIHADVTLTWLAQGTKVELTLPLETDA